MRHFTQGQVREALAFAAAGGQALHTHRVIPYRAGAPRCFLAAVDRGEDIAHLIDHDMDRLRATARRLGLRRVYIDRQGRPGQHVDLCGGPLRRALAMCEGAV